MDDKLGEILKKPFRVSTDSRTIERGDVFFALKGPHFDGHDFLEVAAAKGAACLVVDNTRRVGESVRRTAEVITVDDTLKAYGEMAAAYRKKFKIPVIAVTGSCGKTTAKELIAHVLTRRFKVLKNRGTENNRVGVPKTLFQLDVSHEVLVAEMGTNEPGEIDLLASILAPQMEVLTQIGSSHLEKLGSLEGVKAEKLSMVRSLERGGLLILNGQDPMLADVQSGVHRVLRAGFSKKSCDAAAEQVWCHEKGSTFYVEGVLFETPLVGRHNILNCLIAILVARSLGMKDEEIREALAEFKAPPGRLNLKEIVGVRFIDDTYNSNPTSFLAALDTLKEFKIREKKGVVCGDMLELGRHSETLHRRIGAVMAEHLLDFIVAAGPQSVALADEALKSGFDPKKIHLVKDSVEAGEALRHLVSAGDMVLVKGSRGMKMEKVFDCFITSSIR